MASSVASTKRRPHGIRPGGVVQAARLATAERLVAEGHPRAQFIAEFKLEHPNCDVRTVDRYKALAFNAMRALREAERAHDVEVRIARWIYLSRKFENERQYGPLVAIEKLLAQGMGVLEAEKHLHLHAQGVQQPAQAAISLEVLRRVPDDCLEALENALGGLPALPGRSIVEP